MRVQELTPEQKADKLIVTARVSLMLVFNETYDSDMTPARMRARLRNVHTILGKARKELGEPYDMVEDHD